MKYGAIKSRTRELLGIDEHTRAARLGAEFGVARECRILVVAPDMICGQIRVVQFATVAQVRFVVEDEWLASELAPTVEIGKGLI
jgi:hypothetical protein